MYTCTDGLVSLAGLPQLVGAVLTKDGVRVRVQKERWSRRAASVHRKFADRLQDGLAAIVSHLSSGAVRQEKSHR